MDWLNEGSNALGCELAAEVVRRFGSLRLRVTGTSMAPAVQPGDLLSIRRADLEEVSPGEIVLFTRHGRLFAHRVVARDSASPEPRLLTRGDRRLKNDPPVSSSEFLGRVTSIERGERRFFSPHRLKGPERVLGCLLRFSDCATSLYLKFTSPSGERRAEGAACRA